MVNRLYTIANRLYTMENNLFIIINHFYVVISNLYTIINYLPKKIFLLIVSKMDMKLNKNSKVGYFCRKPF